MFSLTERQLRNTLLAFLRPLSKLLLIAGIDAREFIEIAKSAYVDTATNEFGNKDKPASVLRVSEVTGLTRADVKRVRELGQEYGEERVHDVNHDSFVLHEWFRDPTYHDSGGQPRTLSFGPGAGTFSDLVARAAPDRDPQDMLERLVQLGNIKLGNDGEIEPVSRMVMVTAGLEQAVYTIEWGLLPIMTTTLHNFIDHKNGFLHRNVNSHQVAEKNRPTLRRILRDRTAEFTEAVDDLMAGYEDETIDAADPDARAVGLCICYYEL
jgi:hypothetical protein